MTLNALLALVVGSVAAALPAQADSDFSQCRLPKQVVMTKNLADIPSSVLAKMPGLGATNDALLSDADDPSDPISDGIPVMRLLVALAEGNRWAVIYETGDFANTRTVAFFSVAPEKHTASLIGRHAGLQDAGVCAILKTTFPDWTR